MLVKSLARVSAVPGKTTTINFFTVDGIRFADLPGYGYAKRSESEKLRWGELMEQYFASERNIKLIVQLLPDVWGTVRPIALDKSVVAQFF